MLFVRAGVRRVGMDEVAQAIGVAKGTLYNYVESKEALFDACLRCARGEGAAAEIAQLPVPTPTPEQTLAFVRHAARDERALHDLLAAMADPPTRIGAERSVAALYDVLSRNGTLIRLITGSAIDWPELGAIWFEAARDPMMARLADWVALGTAAGVFRAGLHPAATARLIAETASWFAIHRRFVPKPEAIDDETARTTAIAALCRVLMEDDR